MSEYQNFEWKTVERALSPSQRREVSELSSHITVQGGYAQVDYQWGDFKHDPIRVLERYFDVFAYEANWGQQRIALRFQVDDFDLEEMAAFEVEDSLTLSVKGGNLMIAAEFIENWVEPCGYHFGYEERVCESPVIQALEVIYGVMLAGDFRGLFLLWLEACRQVGEDASLKVCIPPGLGDLAWQHERLIEFIALDRHELAAAQAHSEPLGARRTSAPDLTAHLGKLPADRRDHYLRSLIDGDAAQVRAELRQELKKLSGPGSRTALKGGLVACHLLAEEAEELRRIEARRLAEEKERKRQEYLAELGRREDEIWDQVAARVAEKKPKAYDEAVLLLRGLKDLWTSREDLETFRKGVGAVLESFPRLVGFRSRVEQAGLLGDSQDRQEARFSLISESRSDDPQQRLREIRSRGMDS